MGVATIFITICFFLAILCFYYAYKWHKRTKEENEKKQRFINEVKKKKNIDYIFEESSKVIMLDSKDKKIYIYDCESHIYNFKDVVQVDIIDDNDVFSVSDTTGCNKKNMALGKAIVGGALFGPAGAIIGGTSGKTEINTTTITREKKFCEKLEIDIIFKEYTLRCNFINMRIETNTKFYKKQKEKFDEFLKIVNSIINKNSKDNRSGEKINNIKQKLKDLKEMKDNNLITEEDYNTKKAKLLEKL